MWTQTLGCVLLMVIQLQDTAYCAEHVSLDKDGKYNVSWTYDDTDITFTLQVETTGWIGFGFSPNGGMLNADIVTVEPPGDGEATAMDRFTLDEEILPFIDDEQDWELIGHSVSAGVTTLRLTRKLTVCRSNTQDISISSDTMRLIYAYGPSNNLQYHGTDFRGSKSMYLLVENMNSITDPLSNALYHDFVMDDHTIPAQETTYWCELQKMPTVSKKHHVISYEAIVTPGNELYVHHLLVFGCFNNLTGATFIESSNHSHECYAGNMPEELLGCMYAPLFVWAVGGGAFYYPEEAGVGIGDGTAPDYVLLEMHYDNPHKTAGVRDSSGIRIAYTETLREYDVGLFYIGSVYGILLPPNRPATETAFVCGPTCTEAVIPDTGINVFAGLLHSHVLGRKLTLRHTRSDGSSYIMLKDHSYDFNFQESRHLPNTNVINKGDSLQMTCSMDSSNRPSPTYGGLGTTDEMCLTFLYYYPKISLTRCGSYPIIEQGNLSRSLYTSLGADENSLSSLSYQSVADVAQNITWTPDNGQIVADSYFDYDHYSTCRGDLGFYTVGHGDLIKKETIHKNDNQAIPCPLYVESASIRVSFGVATALMPLISFVYF